MKAIGYIRVSTEEQVKGGISLSMQQAKIRTYTELEDMELIDIVSDEGISGCTMKGRPGIQRVLQMVREKKTDAVIVYKLDRLARNTVEALETAQLMDSKGVGLHSITEKLDTKSAIGRFFFTLMASLAEMERALISERITAAMDRKRELGEPTTGNPTYGFKIIDGKLIPNPYEQQTIDRILALNGQRLSIYRIAEILKRENRVNRKGRPMAKTQIATIIRQRKAA
jgi:site-specific DNA recombinase